MRGVRLTLVLAVLALPGPQAIGADWSATSAWLLQGDDFELGDARRRILRLEHADGWRYGDNYFFVDAIDQRDSGTTGTYGEFAPRLSLGKLTGASLRAGPISDLLLSTSVNFGPGFRAWLYGAAVDFTVPGFRYLQLNAYVRNDTALAGTGWQLTPVWLLPLGSGRLRVNFQGFIDFIGAEGPAVFNWVAAPRLWLDVGALWDAPGHLEVGFEYLYWRDKFGVRGVTERALQPVVRWTF